MLGDSGWHGLCESALWEAGGGTVGDGGGDFKFYIDDAATLVLDLMRVAIRWHSNGTPRHSEALRGSQRRSEAFRGDPRYLEALRGNQGQSEVIRGHKWSSEALRGPQRRSEALRGTQRSLEAIRGYQMRSEVISGHQRTWAQSAHGGPSHISRVRARGDARHSASVLLSKSEKRDHGT